MIITIDPGLTGTGFAIFSLDRNRLFPEKTGVLHFKTHMAHWTARQTEIIQQLESVLEKEYERDSAITKGYIELPTFFQTTVGHSCATGKKGEDSDLVKLAVMVGRIQELFLDFEIVTKLIGVNDWKGTLKKEPVIARIKSRLTDCPNYGNHAWDAVGLGLWVKGSFKANQVEGVTTRRKVRGL